MLRQGGRFILGQNSAQGRARRAKIAPGNEIKSRSLAV